MHHKETALPVTNNQISTASISYSGRPAGYGVGGWGEVRLGTFGTNDHIHQLAVTWQQALQLLQKDPMYAQ